MKTDKIICYTALVIMMTSGCGKKAADGQGGNGDGGGAPQMPPSVVVAGTVEKIVFEDIIQGLGTAEARESIDVTATVTEKVKAIHFEDGQAVEKGALLVELENTEEGAALKEAEVQLKQEKREHKRIKGLVKKEAASESRLDGQETMFEAAKTRLATAESRLAERNLTAPFSGRLGIRRISIGDLVSPGSVITTLDDMEVIKVTFSVPEVNYPELEKGQSVKVSSAAYPEDSFVGTITAIDTRIDPVSRAVTVRAEVPNKEQKLLPGMFLTVDVLKATRESLVVPEGSIVQQGKMYTVMSIMEVIKVTFSVPEVHYSEFEKGQSVKVTSAAYPEDSFEGTITAIDSRIDRVSRAVTVQAEVPNKEQKLLPGMFLTVDVLKATRESLVVPEGSIVQQGKMYTVMSIGEGNIIQPNRVQIGKRKDGQVEILGGLEEGTRIVVEGVQKAWPGMPVQIQGEGHPGGGPPPGGAPPSAPSEEPATAPEE